MNPTVTLALPAELPELPGGVAVPRRKQDEPWRAHFSGSHATGWAGQETQLLSAAGGWKWPLAVTHIMSVYKNLGMDLQLQMFSLILLCYRFTVGTKLNCVLISKKINEQEAINAAPFPRHSVNLHFPRQVSG